MYGCSSRSRAYNFLILGLNKKHIYCYIFRIYQLSDIRKKKKCVHIRVLIIWCSYARLRYRMSLLEIQLQSYAIVMLPIRMMPLEWCRPNEGWSRTNVRYCTTTCAAHVIDSNWLCLTACGERKAHALYSQRYENMPLWSPTQPDPCALVCMRISMYICYCDVFRGGVIVRENEHVCVNKLAQTQCTCAHTQTQIHTLSFIRKQTYGTHQAVEHTRFDIDGSHVRKWMHFELRRDARGSNRSTCSRMLVFCCI